MAGTVVPFITDKILPFTLDQWLRKSSKEKDAIGLFRALKLEINHNREVVRLCMALDDYPSNAELASSMLETDLMDAILLNSGAHAVVLETLGDLEVRQETEEDNDPEPFDRVTADQLLIRAASRIRAFKSIGRNASRIPGARFRCNVRLRNINELLSAISIALP